MRLYAVIIAVLMLLGANHALAGFTVTPGQHDFGDVFVGDTVSFSFIVTNTGNDTNNFTAEMSGIGQGLSLDTDQLPYQWRVAPGDSEFVAVLFHPSGTGYRHRILVVRWSIFFAWNDVSGIGVPAPASGVGDVAGGAVRVGGRGICRCSRGYRFCVRPRS